MRPSIRSNPPSSARLAALDGVRGLAVVLTLVSHLANHGFFGHGVSFQGTGKSGVYLFFVLSAFLLSAQMLRMSAEVFRYPATWLRYGIQRMVRIGPLFLLILAITWYVAGRWPIWHYQFDHPTVLRHLGLQEGRSVLWSIPVEVKAYLVLPLLAWGLRLCHGNRRVAGWLGAGALLGACMLLWPAAQMGENTIMLRYYLPVFICGALAAWWHAHTRQTSEGCSWMFTAVAALALCIEIAQAPGIVRWVTGVQLTPGYSARWVLFHGAIWALFVVTLLRSGPGLPRRIFESRALRAVGLASFSIYLWHMPVLDWSKTLAVTPALRLAIALAVLAVVSALSYLLVERPFQRGSVRVLAQKPERVPRTMRT